MFWSQPTGDSGPLVLLEPVHGALTQPLQQFSHVSESEADSPVGADGLARTSSIQWWDPHVVDPDRSYPEAVTFRWLPPPRLRKTPVYDIILDFSPEFPSPLAITGLRQPTVRIRHLMIDCDYYWRVIAHVGGTAVAWSEIRHLRTHASLPRWIRVPDITNVRDLGGWPATAGRRVRQGMLYRSSAMNGGLTLTSAGQDVLLQELQIRTDLDLRGPQDFPRSALPEQRVRWLNVPVIPYAGVLGEEMHAELRQIFTLLADPYAYPILLHCLAGADRAGTIAWLINGLLGVRLDDLALDYELTSLSVWGKRKSSGRDYQGMLAALGEIAPVEGGRINTAIAEALRRAGITDATMAAIRELLLEPSPPPFESRPSISAD